MPEPETNANWMPEPALWTVQQVAAYLNVSPTTVWNLLREKELVRRRIGNVTRVPKTSVENFIKRDHPTGVHREKQFSNGKAQP